MDGETLRTILSDPVAQAKILAVFVLLAALFVVFRRSIRRGKAAAELHPRLQKYAGRSPEDIAADERAAAKIVATSSTARVAGYRIVRQIEAVFVEGYRTPDEAVHALKAAAGRRGANAIINLAQGRSAGGRATAHGDAIIVTALPGGNELESGRPQSTKG